ncbi:MAG: hypothetical protein PF572_01730 [Patescibacteria group bacterium]|jgi:hypothetical protein|nr:hypothetical protein [Patescibacteria group bacterium]
MKINIQKITLWDVFIILNLISFFGAVVYRLYKLNNLGILITIFLATGGFLLFQKLQVKEISDNKNTPHPTGTPLREGNIKKLFSILFSLQKKSRIVFLITFLYTFLFANSLYILFSNATDKSIISPWQVIPPYFFIFYILSLLTLILITKKSSQRVSLFFISAHFFLSFSIAMIIYKIGYGFDPFIHEATMDIIKEKGFVDPKPLYYLGQYSLIIILNKTLFIPIAFLNKFLIPILASIFLPKVIFEYLNSRFENKTISFVSIIALLILPFSFFIMSTPQNFAYLLLIIIIIKSLNIKNYHDLAFIYLLSLVALVTQPVAGIPAFLFVVSLNIYHSEIKFRKIFLSIIFILMATALPLSFYLFEKTPDSQVGITNNFLPSLVSTISNTSTNSASFFIPKQDNFIYNFIYLYGFNIKLIIFLLFLSGFFISLRYKKECKIFIHFFFASLSIFIAYLFTSSLSFSFLVEYERNNFSNRILLISSFFLLPYILLSFYTFFYRLKSTSKAIQAPIFIFLLILVSTSLYLSYPRFDKNHNSHGVSTSVYDIEATKWIEDNNKRQYLVLANQQVSAAALKNFGFNKYFSGGIFYYPIPTSSPLYNYYLDMVYDRPSKENALKAMNLLNINEVYFVLNKYWWAFPKILDEAKIEADSYKSFGDGEVYVFKYTRE